MQFNVTEEAQAKFDTFSQEGEDMVLRRLIKSTEPGFYVDVGAHHPLRFSNTYYLYKQGWRGINIDPNPGTKELFDAFRPNDINLDEVISDVDGTTIQFDIYSEPAFNSAIGDRRQGLEQYFSHSVERVTSRLDTLLRTHLPADSSVDVLSIDVEGLDLQVLMSNDWKAVRPQYVVTETAIDLRDPNASDVVKYMKSVGYRLRSYLYLSALFIPEDASQY